MTDGGSASRRTRRAILLGCIAAWVVAFVATHSPLPEPPEGLDFSDKTLHVAGYFALATMFWLMLLAYGKTGKVRAIVTGVVMAVYGAFDELTQLLFNRFASFDDWLADLCGIVTAVALMQLLLGVRLASSRRRSAD